MEVSFIFILFVIALALIFDFTNGFHDAANSIATIVSTGVLTPKKAVLWAAFFNFIAFFFFKLAIAKTIGAGLIQPNVMSPFLIFSALVSAISWNIITWYFGLPSSSSHALIGGLAGAAFAIGGQHAIQFSGFIKVVVAIIVSPLLGLVVGLLLTLFVSRFAQHFTTKTNHKFFKYMQLASSALLSLTHGGNDAQKSMGIIAGLLFSASFLGKEFYVPSWVVLSCYFFIALGTLFGGWRIVNTMGNKITKLNPMRGSCAETSAAAIIFAATHWGVPVSTTHTITGAIAGVGLSHSFWGTQWKTMRRIFITWVITIPATGCIAMLIMWFSRVLFRI